MSVSYWFKRMVYLVSSLAFGVIMLSDVCYSDSVPAETSVQTNVVEEVAAEPIPLEIDVAIADIQNS